MDNLVRRFTKWYCRKGYRMEYRPDSVELIFHCPLWVRPLVYFLFSPSIYYHEAGYSTIEGLTEGIENVHTEQRLEDTEEAT